MRKHMIPRARAKLLLCVLSLLSGVSQAQAQGISPTNVFIYSRVSSFSYVASGTAKGLLQSETVQPTGQYAGHADQCVVTSYGYDNYGNKTSTTTANCAGASAEASFTTRVSSTEFGVQYQGRFPTKVTNAMGHFETRLFDERFGAITQLTGPNGLPTTTTVDAFGRATKELRADGTATLSAYCFVAGVQGIDTSSQSSISNNDPIDCPGTGLEAPPEAVSFVHSDTRNSAGTQIGAYVRAYSDRQGRLLRTVKQGFDGASQPSDRRLIAQDTLYNALGVKIGTTQPYFLNGSVTGSSSTTGSNDRGLSVTVYDLLGRPTAVYNADIHGSQTNATVNGISIGQASVQTFSYQGLTTITTNDKGQTRTEEKNISGLVMRVTDHSGAQLAHYHDAFGNLIETRDALQNKITIAYDYRGRKITMSDPDTGASVYGYDALGQLRRQQNARQTLATATMMDYDVLGRMTQRSEPEYTSNWVYDTCSMGKGKLCSTSTTHGVSRTLKYDSLGRLFNNRTDITSGPSFASAVGYDSNGQINSRTYPTGVQVGYSYTTLGALEKLQLNTAAGAGLPANSLLWQAQIRNAWGAAEQSKYGNNVSTQSAFEAATGRVTQLQAGTGTTTNVLNQGFSWDSLGQLTAREDRIGNPGTPVSGAVTESFSYADGLNRLTGYNVASLTVPDMNRSVTLQYNALGMLLYKSDVGNYSYPVQGAAANTQLPRHALQSIAGLNTRYCYDASGNMTSTVLSTAQCNTNLASDKLKTVAYTSFNLPDGNTGGLQGPSGTPAYSWMYDEDHQRIKEARTSGGVTRTTWMLHPDNAGGLGFESEVSGATTSNRHYLSAGGQTIGVLVSTGALPSLTAGQTAPNVLASIATVNKLEYWYKDHLGSLVATTDYAGTVTARYAYDPFGKRRDVGGSYDAAGNLVYDWSASASGGDRGFTGHEHLDDVGLIHMNGRIFDPMIGVFLQSDPMMQDPFNLQNYNRYGYCFNSPMGCTDPSGEEVVSNAVVFQHMTFPQLQWQWQQSWQNRFNSANGFDLQRVEVAETRPLSYILVNRLSAALADILREFGKKRRKPPTVLEAALARRTYERGMCTSPSVACANQNSEYQEAFAAVGETDEIQGLYWEAELALLLMMPARATGMATKEGVAALGDVAKGTANFSRELQAADLGVKGTLQELKGTFAVEDGVGSMRVDMIRGEIKNPLEVVGNMANTAKASGASSLRIEGTIANERLYDVLSRRYGLTSSGATDSITIPLRK